MVYVNFNKPQLVEGFTKKTFTAIIEVISEVALYAKITNLSDSDIGIINFYRTTEVDGVFCYTFFKVVAVKADG